MKKIVLLFLFIFSVSLLSSCDDFFSFGSGSSTYYIEFKTGYPIYYTEDDDEAAYYTEALVLQTGDTITFPTAPTSYVGYIFDSWWTKDGGLTDEWGDQLTSTYVLTSNLVVYAKYTVN